jgi:hypothetical protein
MSTRFTEDNETHDESQNNETQDESHTARECLCPELGSQLPAFIVGLLPDRAAFQVEQHLVKCVYCKEMYLSVLSAKSEETPERKIATPNNGATGLPNGNFGDFNINDK